MGHKRLILVFGEHPRYDARLHRPTASATVYDDARGPRRDPPRQHQRRPAGHEGYRIVKAAGIGTYQIFQETYHHATYARMHPAGTRKGDYLWRLDGLSRAMEAGCDDVGIGALFGLYDWRFEVLGLVSPRPAPPGALRRRAAHDQLPAPPAGLRRARWTRRYPVERRRLQAAHRDPAPGGAVHGPDLHGPRDAPTCGARSWPSASRRSTPAAASRSAATPRPATPRCMEREQFAAGRHPPAGRGDPRAARRTATSRASAPPATAWAARASTSWSSPSPASSSGSARPTR